MATDADLVIQFVNLLHEHEGHDAPAVSAFLEKHEKDDVLQRRAAVITLLWERDRWTYKRP